jgi:hypothetical protein
VGATIAGGGDEAFNLLFGVSYYPNVVTADFGSVGGGYLNTAAYGATVPGGYNNSALGTGSFAAGRNAHVNHDGSFMWGDGSQAAYSTAANRFEVLASGGVTFFTGTEGVNIDQFNSNFGTWEYGLRFGTGSGEVIGSNRNPADNNLYGLDFYTGYAKRMSIANNGFVGINTDTPQQQLDVNGEFLVVDGYGYEQAYMGGDGFGGDVQIGSLNAGIRNVAFYNATSGQYMDLYFHTCTIIGGADLAEPFEMSNKDIPQGAVVVIDEENPGHLKMSEQPYDSRVAGIVSGANGVNSAIKMEQLGVEGGQSVALSGRVYALADASEAPIKPGDLLTTSSVPGHAMKVTDHGRAQGAVLGKAMTGLKEGRGLVLVLVSLQ